MKCFSSLFSMTFLILSSLVCTGISAQDAERQTWVEQGVALSVGQTVKYKTFVSNHFEKGQIIGITDSTFSFKSKKSAVVITIPVQELEAFEISTRSGKSNVPGGVALILVGGTVVLLSAAFLPILTPPAAAGAKVIMALGAASIVGGIIMIANRTTPHVQTIYLKNSQRPGGVHN
jgi:hypothetical protein